MQKIIHPASAANAEVCFNVPAIRIGASFPATGYLRNDGSKMRNGYELGVRMLNEQGGIAGRMVELVTRDDGSDPRGGPPTSTGSSSPTRRSTWFWVPTPAASRKP